MRLGLALLVFVLLPTTSRAAGQGETTVSGGPAFTVLFEGGRRMGGAADLRLLHGLDDSMSLRFSVQAAWIAGRDATPAVQLIAPGLGVTVAADILKLVPFADAGIVFADLRGGGAAARQRLGGQVSLGADYLISRHLALSLLARLDYFALGLAGASTSAPVLLTLGLHLGYVF